MDRKGTKFRTDQPGVVPPDILSDNSLLNIKARMDERRYPISLDQIEKKAAKERVMQGEAAIIKIASPSHVPPGFTPLGTGFYRKGHELWSMKQEGDDFVLVRAAEEGFDEIMDEDDLEDLLDQQDDEEVEDEEKESKRRRLISIPFPDPMGPTGNEDEEMKEKREDEEEKEFLNHHGRQAQVQYSPDVVSSVKDILSNLYSIQLTDEGANDYIHQYRNANPNSPLDPNAIATWINQKRASVGPHRKEAVDSTAKEYYESYYENDISEGYGKALVENKLDLVAPRVAQAYFRMMGRTMPHGLRQARPDWQRFASIYGTTLTNDIRRWMAEGLYESKVAIQLGCSPGVASAWVPVVNRIGYQKTAVLRQSLIRRVASSKLAETHTNSTLKSAIAAFNREVQFMGRKIAVDQAAKDYYKMYYGNYGTELTKSVNELLATAPKAQ